MIDWRKYGFEIIGTNIEPAAAEREILALKPALVILGTEKPQSQGIHFVRAVRKAGADCKIAALVTWWNPEAMGDFFYGGGFDYLLKPLDREMVENVVTRFAGKQKNVSRCYK